MLIHIIFHIGIFLENVAADLRLSSAKVFLDNFREDIVLSMEHCWPYCMTGAVLVYCCGKLNKLRVMRWWLSCSYSIPNSLSSSIEEAVYGSTGMLGCFIMELSISIRGYRWLFSYIITDLYRIVIAKFIIPDICYYILKN